eukprot:2931248-Pyramimonas_sp.AAC.1
MIPLLTQDKDLDAVGALTGLLLTQGHIVVRFQQYAEYPMLLWKMVEAFNGDGARREAQAFIGLAASTLDTGYSKPLQTEAKRGRSDAEAVSWLLSRSVQQELFDFFHSAEGNSLDAERAHNF